MAKNRILFLTDYCLTPFEQIPTAGILCEKDKIIALGGASGFSKDESGLEIVDMTGCYALPGFIDSHIHGVAEMDTANACRDCFSLKTMAVNLAAHGVTTFFPTLVSRPREPMLATVAALAAEIEKGCDDADAPGMHLEGPFLNPEKRGSQDLAALSAVDLGFARELIAAGAGRIKLMTFAPELEDAPKLVELLLENGVIPSMGHSLAGEKDTLKCIDAGARRCTYIFNGMPALFHRDSTLTTVALTDDRVSVEIIPDGIHVHPRMVDIAARCKPEDKLIGISNAVSPGPAPDTPEAGPHVVKTRDGIISGTTMTLENSWLHLMNYAGLRQSHAAACFTSNPAADLGLITRGVLRPGRRADITFFDSDSNQVRMTVSRGRIVYSKNNIIPSEGNK